MKRKAIIFPYNAECASLVRNRELLLNHEIYNATSKTCSRMWEKCYFFI